MTTGTLQHAYEILNAGQPYKARALVQPVIKVDRHNVPAWVLLAITYPEPEYQIKVLEKGLEFNPGSEILERKIKQVASGILDRTPISPSKQPTRQYVPAEPRPRIAPKKRNKYSPPMIAFLIVVALVVGSMFGAGVMLLYQHYFVETPALSMTASSQASELNDDAASSEESLHPPGDGFFLVDSEMYALPAFEHPAGNSIADLVSTHNTTPEFVYQSANYPIENLRLYSYQAGFGLDVEYIEAGALIKTVHVNSPAMIAGLQVGEVIAEVAGESVTKPSVSIYSPGYRDLIGPMREDVQIQVVSGTTSRLVMVARTFSVPGASGNDLRVPYEVIPKDGFIMLKPESTLEPGVYRFEFDAGNDGAEGATNLLNQTAARSSLPAQKWLFVIEF